MHINVYIVAFISSIAYKSLNDQFMKSNRGTKRRGEGERARAWSTPKQKLLITFDKAKFMGEPKPKCWLPWFLLPVLLDEVSRWFFETWLSHALMYSWGLEPQKILSNVHAYAYTRTFRYTSSDWINVIDTVSIFVWCSVRLQYDGPYFFC